MKDEEGDLFLIINKEGDVVIVSINEKGLTRTQYEMLEKVIVISEPSFILLIFLWIDIYLNRLNDFIRDNWRQK